ncbi:rhodanese-like domain-containing protein [Turneriella parva]|uniref:Rhodanese-like protein n=1 Tax=Turneriella parva (strain ATCC BAA-1111 / DSM 21527 / NCTC 11395 / H) TaxID=869212 RepID=I4B3D3_TURPD|nr:rhodanese-like domain-containing protein [Turneriella parva]AFM11790.1 Rhodanese-like protein [Turneriella parva DSM 21527]
MKKLILLAVVAAASVSCNKEVGTPAATIAPAAQSRVKELLDGKALVVDVRTPGEFANGHHPRAVNIPVDQVESRLKEFGAKSQPIVVYCASGVRSSRAKQALESAGYSSVINAGGFKDLP